MGLFRRKVDPVPVGGSRAFWEWWAAEGADRVASAQSEGRLDEVVTALSERVQRVHPGLAWEIAAGQQAARQLVVTADGDPHLRRFARRWLRLAPAADDAWEYADFRQPMPDPLGGSLEIDGVVIPTAEARAAWTRRRNRLEVAIHHPAFADLGETGRTRAAFLLLDQALGEYDVTLWLGKIIARAQAFAPEQPSGDLLELRGAVADLRAELTDEDGGPTWVLMSGETPQGRVMAMARVPLDQVVAPHLDEHLALTVVVADVDHTGFPSENGLRQLRALEDTLTEKLGNAGMLVAHETSMGRRTFHFYIDSTTTAADYIKKVSEGWRQGKVSIKVVTDPPWGAVSHMRT